MDSQKRSEQSLTQRHALGGGRAMHSLSVRFTLACPCGRPVNSPPRHDGLLGLRGEPGCDASEEEEPGRVSGIEERQLARCMFWCCEARGSEGWSVVEREAVRCGLAVVCTQRAQASGRLTSGRPTQWPSRVVVR